MINLPNSPHFTMTTATVSTIRVVTGAALFTASAAHVAWARGSSFPFRSAAELVDNVVGASRAPSPVACYSVAATLAIATALTTTPHVGPRRRAVLLAIAAVFAVRAGLGFSGRTDLLVAGSNSPAFRRNDRLLFSPVCALLAGGIAVVARHSR